MLRLNKSDKLKTLEKHTVNNSNRTIKLAIF